jgi:hypothetical protein
MWNSTVRRFAAVAITLGSAACGGGSDSTGPDNGGNGQFRFTAKIDGANWASNSGAERIGVTLAQAGLYSITGIQLGGSGLTIVMTLTNIPGPGTYPLGVGFSVAGGNVLISSAAGPGWRTAQTGADGSITITTLTSSRIEATFNFTAVPFTGGATGNKTVTDGSFVLEVKPNGTVGALPDNAGHKVSASFNGTSFNAAEVAANYLTSSTGTLSIAATTPTRSLSIQFTGIPANATGTYNISSAIPIRTLGVTTLVGTQVQSSYTSSATGSTGSVTITSFTATRIKGTFTAVLQPIAGQGTGTMTITNGSFDIGRN